MHYFIHFRYLTHIYVIASGITSKAFRSGPSATISVKQNTYFAKCRTGHAQDKSNLDSYLPQNIQHLVVAGLTLADYPNPFGPAHTPSLSTIQNCISHENKERFEKFLDEFFNTSYTSKLREQNRRLADAIVASFLR